MSSDFLLLVGVAFLDDLWGGSVFDYGVSFFFGTIAFEAACGSSFGLREEVSLAGFD